MPPSPIAPGAHIEVRDAIWRVVQVNPTSNNTPAYHVVGVSEIVRDQQAIFLKEYEPSIKVLDPATTKIVADASSQHRAGLLYMESLLRDVPPTDEGIRIGHKAAMDPLDYQLEPAQLALRQPRPRILIADAVGLGKTLEAGILLSELIRRGRGKRILVTTVKSMLTQFQKELWSRFTIPLVRLDSVGLHRIRHQIPTNHNPFYHYDKTIISIDTLKQNNAFRTHVENARWDVIVIDEAHNVADRRTGSLRHKLAQMLASRADALILLSATPHDGKARSFASLMNMLDPTAIANPDEYTKDDIKGLYIRRFKKDVQAQVSASFPARQIVRAWSDASSPEEAAFEALADLKLPRLDKNSGGGGRLFKTSLEKALFSSPAALLQTVTSPLRRDSVRKHLPDTFLPRPKGETASAQLAAALSSLPADLKADITALHDLALAAEAITPATFSKYQRMLKLITGKGPIEQNGLDWTKGGMAWKKSNAEDRLVIFTERIETLKFLQEHLTIDLKMPKDSVAILHGQMSDVEQQKVVEEFGQKSRGSKKVKLRLLLASDVASEGINLHHLSHKMIHFDVPWSLMVFQQRNGRIDRYGQHKKPLIAYLLTRSANKTIRGDTRILEVLIEKDEEATRNIGDPSVLMGVYNIEDEEKRTAQAMEAATTAEDFAADLDLDDLDDFFEDLLGGEEAASTSPVPKQTLSLLSDYDYLEMSLDLLSGEEGISYESNADEEYIEITPSPGLLRRFKKLPAEIDPGGQTIPLTANKAKMKAAIKTARDNESAWPAMQYLWPLNPVLGWAADKMRGRFGRHSAPAITVKQLDATERVVVISGLIPNRRSQPLIHRWYGAVFEGDQFKRLEPFSETIHRTGLGTLRLIPHPALSTLAPTLQQLIPVAIAQTREGVLAERDEFDAVQNDKLNVQLARLEALKERQLAQVTLALGGASRSAEERRIEAIFDEYLTWVEDAMTTERSPFLQVIAVLCGAQS